jgi:hypothetical protein
MSKTWVYVSVASSVLWLAWKFHQWKSVKDSNYDTFKRHWSKEEYESFVVWLAKHPLGAGEP